MWVPAWGRESEGDKGRQVEIEEMGREMRDRGGEGERQSEMERQRTTVDVPPQAGMVHVWRPASQCLSSGAFYLLRLSLSLI